MKKIYSTILLVVLALFSFSISAQVLENESGEFLTEEGYLKDLKPLPKPCCNEESPDLSFSFSIGSALSNHDIIQLAMEQALNAWFDRQENIMKNEIENRFNKTYPNFEQARNDYFNNWEKNNILKNARGVKNRYDYRVSTGKDAREDFARNLKLLELRELELNLGNINNSSYGAFNFNGVPIGNITSINQLNNLRNQEMRVFASNEVSINHNSGVSQFLLIDIINDMGNSNRLNFNYDILNELLSLQINYYNTIGNGLPYHPSWYQLDLMQLYLNNVREPMVYDIPIRVGDFGNFGFLETYANQHRRGRMSIWDDDYEQYLVEEMLHPNETDERAIEWAEYSAELTAAYERQAFLDNLLAQTNTLTDFDTSKLTAEQRESFNTAKENLAENCLGTALLSSVAQTNVEMGATHGPGEYNPLTNTISFMSNNHISSNVLGAELFHAYQQQLYGTLSDIANGTRSTGGSNMEFEEKAFNIMFDILAEAITGDQGISVKLISYPEETEILYEWLVELQFNHPTGPISLSQSELDGWFDALEVFQEFHENNHDHYGDPIDFSQNPDAILNLINKTLESNCN